MKTERPKWQRIALWILSGLLAAAFVLSGGTKLSGPEEMANNFIRWGYPSWFMYVTGAIELVAAVMLLIPRTRFVGAFLLVATMGGAVLTHVVNAEAVHSFPALVLGLLAGVLAYTHRPHSLGEIFSSPAHSHS